jgi:uncharacterized protein YhjY with autotransporter beta-barrel domain
MREEETMKEYFVRRSRNNGEAFYSLSDDRPEWLHDAVREAHDDETPNDWRYDACYVIACMIDDGEEEPYAIADSLTDAYTSDLLSWAAGDVSRLAYCDEVVEDFWTPGPTGVESLLRGGQCVCLGRMASILLEAVPS